MRILRWMIPLMVVTLMFAGIGMVSAQTTNTISGTVVDAQTGEPVPGAVVEVERTEPLLSAETDAQGAYEISGVSAGEYTVTVSVEGYERAAEIAVTVADGEVATADLTLQPLLPEEEADEVKEPGDRKGYVGTFTLGDGTFTITTKKEEVVIHIPEEGLESIVRTPGQRDVAIEGETVNQVKDGAKVAVLVEFKLGEDGAELVQEALQIIVKPVPQPPVVGAVVDISTSPEGVRTLTIMRPNGTTKEITLGGDAEAPEVGEVVTAFPRRGRGAEKSQAKGLVRAAQIRERMEGFLQELTAEDAELSPEAAERRAQQVAEVAEILENHAGKHVDILDKLSQKSNLPPQAVAGMMKALDKAKNGRDRAKANAKAARDKAGAPKGRGRPEAAGNKPGSDRQGTQAERGQGQGRRP